MATIIQEPADTRWGDLGNSLADAIGNIVTAKEEKRKREDRADLLSSLANAPDFETAQQILAANRGPSGRPVFDTKELSQLSSMLENVFRATQPQTPNERATVDQRRTAAENREEGAQGRFDADIVNLMIPTGVKDKDGNDGFTRRSFRQGDREEIDAALAAGAFEVRPPGDDTLTINDPTKLTKGTTTDIQRRIAQLGTAQDRLDELITTIQENPASTGTLGNIRRTMSGVVEQVFAAVGKGELGKQIGSGIAPEGVLNVANLANGLRNSLAPFLTGESRFTNEDIERIEEQLNVMSSASSDRTALTALLEISKVIRDNRQFVMDMLKQNTVEPNADADYQAYLEWLRSQGAQ